MKTLVTIFCLLLSLGFSQAQTNVIYGNVASYTQKAVSGVTVTATLLAPNPRTSGNQIIRQDAVGVLTDTNGNFAFTNLLYGYYSLNVSGA